MTTLRNFLICFCLVIAPPSLADSSQFTEGPVFNDYGKTTVIEGGLGSPALQKFKVLFDVSDKNETENPHRKFDSIARFINMHVRAGVPKENIKVAMVIHSGAGVDLMSQQAFKARFNKEQPSYDLLTKLLDEGVRVIMCGQTAVYRGIKKADLVNGVEMSLSAMTANALLQQQGYTLNPF